MSFSMNRDFWQHLKMRHPDARICAFNPNIAFLPSIDAFAILSDGFRIPEVGLPFKVPDRCVWYVGRLYLEKMRESVPFLRSHGWNDLRMPARGISGEIDWRPFMAVASESPVPSPGGTAVHVDADGNGWVSFNCGVSQVVFETLPVYLEALYVMAPVSVQDVPLSSLSDRSAWLERVVLENDVDLCRRLLALYPTPLPEEDQDTRWLLETLYEVSRERGRHYVAAREITILLADKLAGFHPRKFSANDRKRSGHPPRIPKLLGRAGGVSVMR